MHLLQRTPPTYYSALSNSGDEVGRCARGISYEPGRISAWEFVGEHNALRRSESILLPMVETIQDVHNEKTVGEHHVIRGEPEVINALLEHLRERSLTLEIESDYYENGDYVVEFVKVANSTQDRIQHYLDGEESE